MNGFCNCYSPRVSFDGRTEISVCTMCGRHYSEKLHKFLKRRKRKMHKQKQLKVYFNGLQFFIADSPESATKMCVKMWGEDEMQHEAAFPWEPEPDDKEIGVMDEDKGPMKKTASEWIKTQGAGYLASVDY